MNKMNIKKLIALLKFKRNRIKQKQTMQQRCKIIDDLKSISDGGPYFSIDWLKENIIK